MWKGICKFVAERKTHHLQYVIIAIWALKNDVAYKAFKKFVHEKGAQVYTASELKYSHVF